MAKTKTAKSETTEGVKARKLGPKLQAILDLIRKLLAEGEQVTPNVVAREGKISLANAQAKLADLCKRGCCEWHGEKGGPKKASTRHLKLK